MARTRATAAKSKAVAERASSSGSTDHPSNGRLSIESPKPVVGEYDLSSLPASWDGDSVIRSRIRDELNLCLRVDENFKPANGYVESTKDNVILNASVLKPVCFLMASNNLKLPSICRLIEQVTKFFQIARRSCLADHYYQEAWAIRRLIGKLKTYTYRDHAPQDWLMKIECCKVIEFRIDLLNVGYLIYILKKQSPKIMTWRMWQKCIYIIFKLIHKYIYPPKPPLTLVPLKAQTVLL